MWDAETVRVDESVSVDIRELAERSSIGSMDEQKGKCRLKLGSGAWGHHNCHHRQYEL
jgi:hypothetical protein